MQITPVTNRFYTIQNQNIYTKRKQLNFTGKFSDGTEKPKHVKDYYAYQNFARYNPIIKNFGTYSIPIHNEEIAKRLSSNYTSKKFKSLFDFTIKKGTFNYIMDNKTGFVKTSMINHKENPLMSDLIWITDSCNNLELIKHYSPQDATRVLNKLADLYEGQQDNFDEIITSPEKYHNNEFLGGATQKGIGHCFVPHTLEPHKWFAKTRLESIGNYLQASTDLIKNGLNGTDYGYKTSAEIPDNVLESIANCTMYLNAIHYPSARSCGAWEEWTFVNSLTSDTSIINQGMRQLLDLMYSPTTNLELLKVRERILNTKHGDIFKNKQTLTKLLKDGEQRIISQPNVETIKGDYSKEVQPWEEKYLSRDYDAAMSFMPQTETLNPINICSDSRKKLVILQKLTDKIVRPNGAIRYPQDEYLNLDYHTLTNVWTQNKKKNEAEWFLVSEISCAYGTIAKNLINHLKRQPHDKYASKLLTIALDKQTEYINRSYARITPAKITKSNKYSCPAYRVPEAYEAVTTKNGRIKYVPGAHTPLTWAEASLFKASKLFLENLEALETKSRHNF